MADKQKLTKAGYKKLQDELKYLVDVATLRYPSDPFSR